MDADEQLARQLQEEEDRAVAQLHSLTGRGGEQAFQARLQSGVQTILTYEDETLQAMALSVIPEDDIQDAADKAIAESRGNGESPVLAQQDAFARQLLLWFKRDFFSWVNNPPCSACKGTETVAAGMGRPSADDAEGNAGRVELYGCKSCGAITRFPRYNDPGRLLQTRRGRCGEWANAFALCCRAVGLEARYILDLTDHVWVEYWSDAMQQWVHMDPCEAAYDQPLLYEDGWGKKLNYIIAFSKDGVKDVTRRYTQQWGGLQIRRAEVSEPWLMSACYALTVRLRSQLAPSERGRLEQRDAVEDGELSNSQAPPPNAETPLPGRKTGSVEWRAARGELGRVPATSTPAAGVEPDVSAAAVAADTTDASAGLRKAGSFPPAGVGSSREAERGSAGGSGVGNAAAQELGASMVEAGRALRDRLSLSSPPRGARPRPQGDHSAAQALLAARVKREFARLMAAGGLSPNEAALLALKAAS